MHGGRIPALILGGGPAGAAAAITLARAGMTARIIDRAIGPRDCVCGGFLGWDALAALRRLGIDAGALGARPISRLRLVADGRRVELPLPHPAAGLSRRALDEALIHAAGAAGAILMRGRTVRAVEPDARALRLDNGNRLAADALVLATGKHEVRGLARDLGKRRETPAAGLRTILPASPARLRALTGIIELHLFDGGYAGLLLQEDDSVNLCLSVARHRLRGARSAAALLAEIARDAPALAERLATDSPQHFQAVAGVPYGWRAAATPPGIFRIGDQGAVIASLAGDGIALALTSGESAAQALLAGGPNAALQWQRHMHRRSRRAIGIAEALRHTASGAGGRALLMRLVQGWPQLGTRAALLTRI